MIFDTGPQPAALVSATQPDLRQIDLLALIVPALPLEVPAAEDLEGKG